MKVLRILLALSLSCSQVVGAEPEASQPEVVITAAGEAEPTRLVEARTRALLREYPVTIEWSVRADFRPREVFEEKEGPALARIWLDLRDDTRAVLYVVDVAHERFLVRVVPLESGIDEVASESLGTILQSSVEALLAGATLGVSREAAEQQVQALEAPTPEQTPPPPDQQAAPQVPAPPPPPPPRYRLALEAAYRAQMLAEGPALLQGPELGVSLLRPGARASVGGFLAVGYRAPLHWQEESVGAQFEGLGVRQAGGVRFGLGKEASVGLLASVGVDGLYVEPIVSGTEADPRGAFWIAMPTVGVHVEADLPLGAGLSLWGSLGAEVDLLGHHFDVLEGGQAVTVLQAWRVQPVLRMGLRFTP